MTPTDLGAALTALGYGAYVPLIPAVIGICSALAAVLGPERENSPAWYRIVRTLIDLGALNVGNARNAPPAAPADLSPADVAAIHEQLTGRDQRQVQPSVTQILNNAPPG